MDFRSPKTPLSRATSERFYAPLACGLPPSARVCDRQADTRKAFHRLRLIMNIQFLRLTTRRFALGTAIVMGLGTLAAPAEAQQRRVIQVSLPEALQLAESHSEAV